MITRRYSELVKLETFKERYQYLKIGNAVAQETFGFRRWLNQSFYHSKDWLNFRDKVIIRDNGCDLGIEGFEIYGSILIHHLNPITYEDIVDRRPCVFDMENVICTTLQTHNAIHYGDENLLVIAPIQRKPNDTCPWRKIERS